MLINNDLKWISGVLKAICRDRNSRRVTGWNQLRHPTGKTFAWIQKDPWKVPWRGCSTLSQDSLPNCMAWKGRWVPEKGLSDALSIWAGWCARLQHPAGKNLFLLRCSEKPTRHLVICMHQSQGAWLVWEEHPLWSSKVLRLISSWNTFGSGP